MSDLLARKCNHSFSDPKKEYESLIYNFDQCLLYTSKIDSFDQCYVFK